MSSINLMSQFSVASFNGYLEYINKQATKIDDSIKNVETLTSNMNSITEKAKASKLKSFSNYISNYMSNNSIKKEPNENSKKVKKRTTQPFNNKSLNKEDLEKLKSDFDLAEKNGCVNYQDIISFDNDFLIEQGMYEPYSDTLNENAIKEATEKMIDTLIKKENMIKSNTRWMANIHYDTDNIHIHISTTEIENTRPYIKKSKKYKDEVKGERSEKTLEAMKSSFSNSLLDNSKLLQAVTEKRNELYSNLNLQKSTYQEQLYLQKLKRNLPSSKKDWQYNNKKCRHLQNEIDSFTSNYLYKHDRNTYASYKRSIKEVAEFYTKVYGKNSKASNYINNKEKEIRERLGNKLLKSLKTSELDKEIKIKQFNMKRKISNEKNSYKPLIKNSIVTKSDVYKIKRAISNEAKEFQNKIAYEKLQAKIDYQNTHQI